MLEEKTGIKQVNVEKLCELIMNSQVKIEDRFRLAGSFSWATYLYTIEIVYEIFQNRTADTIVYSISERVIDDVIQENRYMAEGKSVVQLASHKKGSKDYHKLLEEIK